MLHNGAPSENVPSTPLFRDPSRSLAHLGVAPRDGALPSIVRTLIRDIDAPSRCSRRAAWSPKTLTGDSMPQHAGVDTPSKRPKTEPCDSGCSTRSPDIVQDGAPPRVVSLVEVHGMLWLGIDSSEGWRA
jgi:hypothetical protein